MDKKVVEQLKKLVNKNYESSSCGYTSERSGSNTSDVFEDGTRCGQSWLAYEVGCILGMDLEEPEEPNYGWED